MIAAAIVASALVLALVWSNWNTMRHYNLVLLRLLAMHEETVRKLYVLRAGEDLERAQALGQLDLMSRTDPTPSRPAQPVSWDDDDALSRE